MLNVIKTNFLVPVTNVIIISHIISACFLITYYFHTGAFPAGNLEQYTVPFMEFNLVLMSQLIPLVLIIMAPIYYSSEILSIPEVAKYLFGIDAGQVVVMLKSGVENWANLKLMLKLSLIYIALPTLYFAFFLIVSYANLHPINAFFSAINNIFLCLFPFGVMLIIFKKNLRKPWLIWLNIFLLAFAIGAILFFNAWVLYLYRAKYSVPQPLHSGMDILAAIFLLQVFISSVGLINTAPNKLSLLSHRIAVAITCLLVIFSLFNLSYAITAANLKSIGQNHIPLQKFHTFFSPN